MILLPRQPSHSHLMTRHPPTHPLSISTVFVQSAAPPLSAARSSDGGLSLPLRLKSTFNLLLPYPPAPGSQSNVKLASVLEDTLVFPSRHDGGVVEVGLGVSVRGEAVVGLGWVKERTKDLFDSVSSPLRFLP